MFKSYIKALVSSLRPESTPQSASLGAGSGNVAQGHQTIRIDGAEGVGNAGSGNFSTADQYITVNGGARSGGTVRSSPVEQRRVPVHGSFSRIEQMGPLDVEWTASDEVSVVVHAEQHVLPMLDVRVQGDTLVVATKTGNWTASKRIVIVASSPSVKWASTRGSGSMSLTGVSADSLAVDLAGSGDIDLLSADVSNLSVQIVGSGGLRAAGVTSKLDVGVAGSGNFDGRALQSENAKLTLSGSGNITARVREDVQAVVKGSGNIKVHGASGSRNTSIKGSGDIKFH